MALTTDRMDAIVIAVTRGDSMPKGLSDEEKQFWKDVTRDIAAMPAGAVVEIPGESVFSPDRGGGDGGRGGDGSKGSA